MSGSEQGWTAIISTEIQLLSASKFSSRQPATPVHLPYSNGLGGCMSGSDAQTFIDAGRKSGSMLGLPVRYHIFEPPFGQTFRRGLLNLFLTKWYCSLFCECHWLVSWVESWGNKSMNLHRRGPLLENGLDIRLAASKCGLSNGGLRPLSAMQLSAIVHICGPFAELGPFVKATFSK